MHAESPSNPDAEIRSVAKTSLFVDTLDTGETTCYKCRYYTSHAKQLATCNATTMNYSKVLTFFFSKAVLNQRKHANARSNLSNTAFLT